MKLTAILTRITAVIAVLLISIPLISQIPTGFHYQAVARGQDMEPIIDQVITLHFSIYHENGSLAWEEKHFVQTNSMGLFSLNICENGDHRSGGYATTPDDIDWGSGMHSLQVELEEGGNMIDLGTHRIMSVPYASYAAGGPDADPENELQDLQLEGNLLKITGNPEATAIDLGTLGGGEGSWTRSGNRLIYLDGNVGIGTDDPFRKLTVNGAASVRGLEFPNNFGPDTAFVGTEGNYLAFGHQGVSEDFIGYKNNTFYLKDAPGGGDVTDPNLVVGGNLSIGTDYNAGRMTIQASEGMSPGDPLFMIKRSDGYPVFAVYEDEVWVYTDTAESVKGLKGGFAVGGYKTPNKGPAQEYMRVTPDSIRFYIDQGTAGKASNLHKGGFAVGGYKTPSKSIGDEFLRITPDSVRVYIDDDPNAKGLKGGFAVGGYKTPNKGGAQYFNVSGKNVAEEIPGENRVVWYPQKNALMAGNVIVQSPDSVGTNSMSTGYRSKAIGGFSEAFGYQSVARGNYSTAIGKNATAQAENSVSIGNQSLALRASSFAFGTGARAYGINSYAIGSAGVDSLGNPTGNTIARGENSFAMGMGAESIGLSSLSFGTESNSAGEFSVAAGYQAIAGDKFSIALGANSRSNGYRAVSLNGAADNNDAVAISAWATGAHSLAMMNSARATGTRSIAIGGGEASGDGGLTLTTWIQDDNTWYENAATGVGSTAIGHGVTGSGKFSMSIGTGASTWFSPQSQYGKADGDYSTVIGYYSSTRQAATYSTAIGFQCETYDPYSTAIGIECTTYGNYSFAAGIMSNTYGDYSSAFGMGTAAHAFASFATGVYNEIPSSYSATGWVSTDPVFVVGNGNSYSTRSNALTILKNGYVGINDSKPTYRFQIYESRLNYAMSLHNDRNSNSASGIRISCGPDVTNSTSAYAIAFLDGDGTWMGSISIRNSQVTFNETSDRRLKTNINPTSMNGLDMLEKLEVVDYAFKERPENMLTGFIAQDVEQVVPAAVSQNEEGTYELSQIKLIPVLTKALQEQHNLIKQKDERIEDLEARLAKVEALLDIK